MSQRHVIVRGRHFCVRHPLWRRLHLPRIAPGAACPLTSGGPASAFSPYASFALGDGPAWPIFASQQPVLLVAQVRGLPGLWGQKVLWITAPGRPAGRILLRGRRLDAPGVVRFERGALRTWAYIRRDASRWQDFPSHTLVPGPGCYAYQIDGPDFSDVIVFEARAESG